MIHTLLPEKMSRTGAKLIACLLLGAAPLLYGQAGSSIALVSDGEPAGAIVLATEANPLIREAAEMFVKTVKKSTGATLPIVSEAEAAGLEPEVTRLFLGPCQEALKQGLDPARLKPESYRMVARDHAIYIIGTDREDPMISPHARVSRPTLWALNRILEDELQVRWLWPGELGTVIPRHPSLKLAPVDRSYQPRLMMRSLRYAADFPLASTDQESDLPLKKEAKWWGENHQIGKRGNIKFRHAFTHWWEKYSKKHPDYFADLGKIRQPYLKPSSVKLRLSNPKVIEQIAVEYIEAGKPKYYNVCPNDGSGFDVHPDTLAWDIPANQPVKDIITARGQLTARYVKFWNLLYERLVKINPDVVLTTYAYSSYRNPPPPERPLTAKAILGIVSSYDKDSYGSWKEWARQAEGLFLRPNWWHLGSDAPYLALKETYDYIKFAFENGMLGIDMDSVLGYWGTQGVSYYMVARQMVHPELTLDQILDEYTSAFGRGAPKIREYIDYWQKVTTAYDYPINGAKDVGRLNNPDHPYGALVREGKIPGSILVGSKYVLPYLYGEEVLAPGERLLDEARAMIGTSDEAALARVEFLRKGLMSLRATRDQIALGQRIVEEENPELLDGFADGAKKLDELRERLAREHVIWAAQITNSENRRKIVVRPETLKAKKINLDGM
ncbi:MAG TPA: DUF4838 domain-containing protein [Chthoniobacteraceae bacterium]|nr:DUF4838 domain-containing protein [Chthoniobacteraceae bacterium]